MELFGFQHSAFAVLFARELASIGTKDNDAIGGQLCDVSLGGFVPPHLAVHRGCDEQWTITRETERRQQIVGDAMRELGNEIRRRGRDQNGISAARKRDVAHRIVRAGVPEVRKHRTARKRLERRSSDKLRARCSQDDVDRDVVLDEQSDQLGSFIGGDAARDAEHNARQSRRAGCVSVVHRGIIQMVNAIDRRQSLHWAAIDICGVARAREPSAAILGGPQ